MLVVMNKEDLIKRIRLFVIITTVTFVVLVVTLLVQFGFIAHYNMEMKRLQRENEAIQEEIKHLEEQIQIDQAEKENN